MIIAIDTNCLVRWSAPSEYPDESARLDHLLSLVAKEDGKIIIPMPVFAEYLVGTNEATIAWITALDRKKSIALSPFDKRSAFECAAMDRSAIGSGDKKNGRLDPWQRIKIDRQIIAIAKVNQVDFIVSEDGGLISTAAIIGLPAKAISELTLPESAKQINLDLAKS